MRLLKWNDIAPKNESFHISRLNLSGSQKKSFETHGHDFAELFLIERGELIHSANGHTAHMKKGDIGLIRPGDHHGFRSLDAPGFLYSNFAFSQKTFADFSERYFSKSEFWGGNASQPLTLSLPDSSFEWLRGMILQLGKMPPTRFELDRFLLNFYSKMQSALFTAEPEGKPQWLEYACNEIRRPKLLKTGLKMFHQLAGHCPEHVGRELKKYTGLTPSEFILQLRLECAARLLLQSDMKVDDISSECGFHHLGYFYSTFKKRHGCTPRRYRLTSRTRII